MNGKRKLKVEDLEGKNNNDSEFCPICYEPFSFKTTLPDCRHEFCFLCIKGVSMRGGNCPMCRKSINKRLFVKPTAEFHKQQIQAGTSQQIEESGSSEHEKSLQEVDKQQICWLYESRGSGWWRFERRQEKELEVAFHSGAETHELLIAGFLYTIDFKLMLQYKKGLQASTPAARKIRRIVGDELNKERASLIGVAGLR